MVICPECGTQITQEDYDIHEIIECPACGVELEVVSLSPFTLALFEEEEK